MPYKTNNDLPDNVKGALPNDAQTIWRNAFNSSHAKDQDEEKANKVAWGAVKNAGWTKKGDEWIKMQKDEKFHEFDAEVFSAGTWTDSSGRTDKYTVDDLKDMANNFQELKDSVKPPFFVKLGHGTKQESIITEGDQPALGWIKNLKVAGEKLIATLSQVPDVVKKAIDAGLYKRISSEIFKNYKHAGKTFKNVLARVALLGATIPAIDNLADLDAYLSQSTNKGSFDAISLYAFSTDKAGKIINLKTEISEMEEKEYQAKIAELQDKLKKAEGDTDSEKKEKEDLKAQLAKFEKDREDEKRKSAIEKVKTYCEDMVKAGKMLPYQRDILVQDIDKRSYSTEDGHIFTFELIEKLFEKVDKILDTKEYTHDKDKDGDITDPAEILAQLTTKYMRENPTVDYQTASDIVFEQNPKLAKAYALDEGGEV